MLVLASCSQPDSSSTALGIQAVPSRHGNALGVHAAGPANAPVCPGPAAAGTAGCTSRVIVDQRGTPQASSSPQGYAPYQIRSAYGFGSLSQSGAGTTVAIVDAYDDPNIASDLEVFKAEYGYGAGQCNLTKVDQTGGTAYPKRDAGWALEISLDVQWACAIAPGANILLVEAASNSYSDLFTAVHYAAAHANVVSMSWGGSESSSETGYDGNFSSHGNVTFIASSGDSGAGVIYPAASPYVVGVGGTTLPLDANGNLTATETAWSGSGGGVSGVEPEPGYQATLAGGENGVMLADYAGGKRGVPDVAYDADPSTGFSVYDSVRYQGQAGWFVVGGTSAGAPQWAALIALADASRGSALASTSTTSSPVYAMAASSVYASNYFDIQSGSDCTSSGNPGHGPHSGGGSGNATVCTAAPGYDFVTGLGSPDAANLVAALASY
ncbi:MAG TPA: S53 family peptidase [Trueperaceae bacterium]|nr:S53 family peptidase [Trueperaceae bacterium]